MDPRQAECLSYYLYGAGYFARDDNTLGIITGQGIGDREHFCLRCPRMLDCIREQHARVREHRPAEVERFERATRTAVGRGFSALLAEFALADRGLNPFFSDAMENFKRGHGDRGASAGTLIQSKGEG